MARGDSQCDGSVGVDRYFGFPGVQGVFRDGITEGRDPRGSWRGRREVRPDFYGQGQSALNPSMIEEGCRDRGNVRCL